MKQLFHSLPLIFLLCIFNSSAQDSLSINVLRLFNEGLDSMGLHQRDLYFPHDYYQEDLFRLDIVKSALENPLTGYDIIKEYEAEAAQAHTYYYERLAKRINEDLKMPKFRRLPYSNILPLNYMEDRLGINIDSAMGIMGANLMRQYLSPMLLTIDALDKDLLYANPKNVSYLIENTDSLLLPRYPEPGADVVETMINSMAKYKMAKEYLQKAYPIRYSNIISYGFSLYAKLMDVNELTEKNIPLFNKELKTSIIETEFGRIGIGGPGSDSYSGHFILIIDVGGDDSYIFPTIDKKQNIISPVTCIIDFGGNDAYIGGDYSLGGSLFGISILMDFEGNDSYSAGNFSLGSGAFGFGLLRDDAGSDIYSGGNCSMGSGAFGAGLFIDLEGDDIYTSLTKSQGFGFSGGTGIMIDHEGSDSYITRNPLRSSAGRHFAAFTQGAALGFRPYSSGGIGLLFDLGGNDNYITDYFGQASAFWYGLAGLVDEKGNDKFQGHFYTQASASHFSNAWLINESGHDFYIANNFSQALSEDYSIAFLGDFQGNDNYIVDKRKIFPDHSLSITIDTSGQDSFKEFSIPYYAGFESLDNIIWMKVITGNDDILYRFQPEPRSEEHVYPGGVRATKKEYPIVNPIGGFGLPGDSLSNNRNRPGINNTTEFYRNLYPYYLVPFNSDRSDFYYHIDPLEFFSYNIDYSLFDSPFFKYTPIEFFHTSINDIREYDSLRKIILERLSNDNINLVRATTWLSRAFNDSLLFAYANQMAKSPDWRRRLSVFNLEVLNREKISKNIAPKLVTDSNRFVRATAAYFSACQASIEDTTILKPLIMDSLRIVKESVMSGLGHFLKKRKKLVDWLCLQKIDAVSSFQVWKMLRPAEKWPPANYRRKYVLKQDVSNRDYIYKSMMQVSVFEDWVDHIEYFAQKEKNPELKAMLNKYLDGKGKNER